MSVTVTYECGGCDATASVGGLHQSWEVVVRGRPLDKCREVTPTIESAAPEGWVPFDPYTGMCYCPKCWAAIIGKSGSSAA